MDFFLITYLVFLVSGSYKVLAQSDPCSNYTTINDSSMSIDYRADTSLCRNDNGAVDWFRYVTTASGLIVTSCPRSSSCGCDNQIWINDTLPAARGVVKKVSACLRSDDACCTQTTPMDVKNCGSFIVFNTFLRTGFRICFENSSVVLPTISTVKITSTTNATTNFGSLENMNNKRPGEITQSKNFTDYSREVTASENISREGSMSYTTWFLLGILTGILSTILIALIVVFVYRKYKQYLFKVRSSDAIFNKVQQPDTIARTKFYMQRNG